MSRARRLRDVCGRPSSRKRGDEPLFAFHYDEADIEWMTGSVKIPRKRDRFCPTFSRAEFNAYFFEETGQTKAAIAALGLSTSPAADATGLRTPPWSTPLDQVLSGNGPGTLNYALRSIADTTGVNASSSTAKAKPEPEQTSPKPSGEIFSLKPTVYGVGVDLKELARRFRAWRARRRSTSS